MAKSKSFSEFGFKGVLSSIEGALIPTVIYLPEAIVKKLPPGRLRTKGTVNGIPFALAPQHKRDGSRYFAINASLRKAAHIKEGSKVEVKFKLIDPDAIEVPDELEAVLAQDDKARKAWDELTSGVQRNIIHHVTAVKNIDGRIKRCLEALEKAKLGLFKSRKIPKKN